MSRPKSAATYRSSITNEKPQVPKFVARDRQVLRFYGYFIESVHESALENERIRKCIIYFYLEDCSIRVNEPKSANSGIPQGVFAKRIRYRKSNGSMYSPKDFKIGGYFTLNGRRFMIVDCDSATRSFYSSNLSPLAAALPYPEDRYSSLLRFQSQRRTTSVDLNGSGAADTLRQFLQHDRQVLRFDAYWDDTAKLYGERRKFVIHYYLSNDTVEVREVNTPNSGRDPFPLLLRRQKLMKSDGPGGARVLRDADLRCGAYVSIFNREFLLTDCDAFTRSYYQDKYGTQQIPVKVRSEERVPVPAIPIPPPTGFGSEEDSLSSVYHLHPTAPKKNFKWAQRNSRKVLRFRAKLQDPKREEIMRRFVISFFMEDNSMSIFEPPIRNSGIAGGKFLERHEYKNPNPPEGGPPRPFVASDFYIGAVVSSLHSSQQSLLITDSDDFTLKFCESNPRDFPRCSVDRINAKILNSAQERKLQIRGMFRANDPEGTQLIHKDRFRAMLSEELGLTDLVEQELITIQRRFCLGPNERPPGVGAQPLSKAQAAGQLKYEELCDTISRIYGQMFPPDEEEQDEEALVLSDLRVNNTQIRAKLTAADAARTGAVSVDKFKSVLNYYHIRLSSSELAILQRFSTHPDPSMIQYHAVCDAVFPCDFTNRVSMMHSQSNLSLRSASRSTLASSAVDSSSSCSMMRSVPGMSHTGTPADGSSGGSGSGGLRGADMAAGGERRAVGWADSQVPQSLRGPATSAKDVSAVREQLRITLSSKKYQLRKQFRLRDVTKDGKIGEDGFMDAVAATTDELGDDEMYKLAEDIFPEPGSRIDYQEFMDKLFG